MVSVEGNFWKVIAWDVEPEDARPEAVPDTRKRAATPSPAEHTKADAELLHSSQQFLTSWLVADNFSAAAQYFSPRSSRCAGAFVMPGEPEPQTPEQSAAVVRAALTTIGKDVGQVQHLSDAIEPVEPEHDDLKLVTHPEPDAYALVSVPGYLASSFTCQEAGPSPQPVADAPVKDDGKYYAMLFALRTPGDHPASLAFLWSKQDGQWKIVSYSMMAP